MSRRRRGGACCRRQCWGGGSGRHASAPPPTTSHRAGGPLLGLGHLSPTLPGTPTPTTHGGMRGGGRAAGGWVSHSRSPSHGRPASVALASFILGGGGCGHPRWLRRRPQLHCPPPPLQLWARPAGGAGGRDRGAQALRTFLAPSRPRSLMRRGRMGLRVAHPHPGIASSKELQGGFGMDRVKVPPHPSVIRGSRMLQDRVWGSRVLQGRDWGSRMLQGRVWGSRMLQGRAWASRMLQGRVWGSRMLQGRVWGSRVLQGNLWCRLRGSQRLLLWVRGIRDRARVGDRVVPPPLRHGAAPPPSLRGGAAQAQERGSATRGGRAARGADRQGRPSQRRGAAARLPTRGGGLLSLGFTRQVQSSGGGDAQPPTAAPAPAGADGGAHSPRSGQGRSSEDPT